MLVVDRFASLAGAPHSWPADRLLGSGRAGPVSDLHARLLLALLCDTAPLPAEVPFGVAAWRASEPVPLRARPPLHLAPLGTEAGAEAGTEGFQDPFKAPGAEQRRRLVAKTSSSKQLPKQSPKQSPRPPSDFASLKPPPEPPQSMPEWERGPDAPPLKAGKKSKDKAGPRPPYSKDAGDQGAGVQGGGGVGGGGEGSEEGGGGGDGGVKGRAKRAAAAEAAAKEAAAKEAVANGLASGSDGGPSLSRPDAKRGAKPRQGLRPGEYQSAGSYYLLGGSGAGSEAWAKPPFDNPAPLNGVEKGLRISDCAAGRPPPRALFPAWALRFDDHLN